MNFHNTFRISEYKSSLFYGLATGIYPFLFYYSNNFSLINSLKHFGFFLFFFLFFPVGLFIVIEWSRERFSVVEKYILKIITFFNLFLFLLFIFVCLYAGLPYFQTLIALGIAFLGTFFFHKYLYEIVVFQYIIAVVGLFFFVPRVYSQLTFSEDWKQQPDAIEQVVFKKKPNVYYIQTDGYVNFSEIDKGYYNYNNDAIKQYLEDKDFTIYNDIRSNYTATLESNMATFVMKHHYYNSGFTFSEMINARETIITDNPVLNSFKKNGYKTHFLAEWPYLITNFPKLGYDYCNFKYNDVSLVSEGFEEQKQIFPYLKSSMQKRSNQPHFYFIEILDPGHVEARENKTEGASKEKDKYFEKLERCNKKLIEILDYIDQHDPEALVLIMGDHGGYIGFDYMLQIREKQEDRDLLYSAFSTQLAIKWPNNNHSGIDIHFKSAVNTFRILFSYLSDNQSYLQNLQEDASYTIIYKGAPRGIYKVIDNEGVIVFDRHE